ncbi:MAG: hypothetical protein Kow0042_15840 [Calditrichia bacterium]
MKLPFHELEHLGFDHLRNALIHIPNDEQHYFMDYDFSAFTGGQIGKVEYGLHPIVDEYLEKIRSAEDAFCEVVIDEDMLDSWNDFRRKSGQMYDQRLDEADALYYYLFSIGSGDIGISTFKPIDNSQIKILKRFRNVFGLAYKRYTDITLAAIQAREALIEAALERVRAKAMGMRKSEEVSAVSDILFSELNKLDLDIRGCSIVVINEQEDKMELWRARSNVAVKPFERTSLAKAMTILKKYTPDFFPKFLNAVGTRKGYLIDEFSGKRRLQLINAITEQYNYSKSEKSKLIKNTPETITTHYIFFKLGYLALLSEKKLTDDDLSIAGRFIEVFSFAYSRFLDIKKAEAQAREAQIEAALERVRSRSMAMHSSDELVEASDVMFAQMKKLGIETLRVGICTIDAQTGAAEVWSRSEIKGKVQNKILGVVPFGVHPVFDGMVNAWREKKPYFASERAGEEVKEYYEKLAAYLSYPMPKEFNEKECITTFFFTEGSLNVISLQPLNEDECHIMGRFARVFGQMFRRFLDLQKSEAQAREAQIEAALEKVRSRTMAMQRSDELAETAAVLFRQLTELGVTPERLTIGLIKDETKEIEVWSTDQEGIKINHQFNVSLDEQTSGIRIYEAWKEKKKSLIIDLSGQELNDWIHYVREVMGMTIKEELVREHRIHSVAFFSQGIILTTTPEPLPEESIHLLERFADVFNLTYRRFLDLEKAEARAREAQIETALEKVRARALTMQKSDELMEVATVLRKEMAALGVEELETSSIYIVDKNNGTTDCWYAIKDIRGEDNKLVNDHMTIRLEDTWVGREMQKFYASKNKQTSIVMQGENRKEWINYCADHSEVLQGYYGDEIPERTYHLLKFSNGYMGAASPGDISAESWDLLQRAASVFSLAFTRFLDLQHAEEQNKIISAENERKTKELEEARQLQLSMLPKELPQLPHLDIAVYMQTATEVGGDYYDFAFKEDGSLNIALGDATGHGMKAGIMVSSMKSIFTTNSTKMDMPAFFATANNGVKSMGLRRMMMGFALLNLNSDQFFLVNAGMPPIFWYRHATDSVEEISEHGMPIGAMKNARYGVTSKPMESGDALLLLTDGMPELQNDAQEMFGYSRIKSIFRSVGKESPAEIINHLKAEASRWTNGKPLHDDVTFLVIKKKPSSAGVNA